MFKKLFTPDWEISRAKKDAADILRQFDRLVIESEGNVVNFTISKSVDLRLVKDYLPSQLVVVENGSSLAVSTTPSFSQSRYNCYYLRDFESHLLNNRSQELQRLAPYAMENHYLSSEGIYRIGADNESLQEYEIRFSDLGLKELTSNGHKYTLARVLADIKNSKSPYKRIAVRLTSVLNYDDWNFEFVVVREQEPKQQPAQLDKW